MALDNYQRTSYLVPITTSFECAAQDRRTYPFGGDYYLSKPLGAPETSVFDSRLEPSPQALPNVEAQSLIADGDLYDPPSPRVWAEHSSIGGASEVSATGLDTADGASMEDSRTGADVSPHHAHVLPSNHRNHPFTVATSGMKMGTSTNDSWDSHVLVYGGLRMQPVTPWEAYYLESMRTGPGGERTTPQFARQSWVDRGSQVISNPPTTGEAEMGVIVSPRSDSPQVSAPQP